MSDAEKRVEIAQEVLLGLQSLSLVPSQNVYVRYYVGSSPHNGYHPQVRGDLDKAEVGRVCTVCACGALAVAAVRKGLVTGEGGVWAVISRFFEPMQAALIESVFMGCDYEEYLTCHASEMEDYMGGDMSEVEKWWDKFRIDEEGPDLEGALKAAMENIIRHNGEFEIGDLSE